MAKPPRAWDPSLVLAHDRYLRALAHSLVADAQSAEDLAQQAWVRALEHRPSGTSFHAWLRTTLDRLAATWRRSDARRHAREHAAARPEGVPSHEELWERETTRRAVVDAVLRLPEPYRSTVALRFFEGLPPRAIARRMNAPVETVRTRLKTALKQLRATLDREHGDRRAWCLALAPIAKWHALAAVPILAGALAMTLKTKVLATAIVCAALLFLVWNGSDPDGANPHQVNAEPAAIAVQVDAVSNSPAIRVPIATSPSNAAEVATTGSLVVHLRWSDGAGAEDVGVRVRPRPSDAFGYAERDSRTNADGDARFAGLAPGQVSVDVDRLETPARTTIEAGREAEVTVRIGGAANLPPVERGRLVEGSVVTPDGAPVAGAEILLSSSWRSRPIVATHSAADGTFVLRDVDSMFVIGARAAGFVPSGRSSALRHLMMQEDPTPVVRMRLVLGPAAGRVHGLVRDPQGVAVAGAIVQIGRDLGGFLAEDVQLADGTRAVSPTPARARTDTAGAFACASIPAGRNDVVVRALGFGAWSGQVDVTMGRESMLTIDLVPGVTVRGRATDSKGTALEGLKVQVGMRSSPALLNKDGFLVATTTATRADGTYELRDLAHGEIVVVATRPNRGEAEAILFGNAGDVLAWDPILEAGQELHGRVVDERGAPVEARVRARAAPRLLGDAETDQRGAFAIANWRDVPTQIDVIAKGAGSLPCARVEDARPGADIVITVRDTDLPSAYLTGTLLGSDGKPPRAAELYPGNGRHPQVSPHGAQRTVANRETGAFKIGPLPAGTWGFEVRSAGDAWLFVTGLDLGSRETRDLGTLRLQRPAILDVTAKRGDGAPLAAASWPIANERGEYAGWIVVQDGTGHHDKLATGTYLVQARGEGVAHSVHRISVVSGERTRLDVTQAATSTVAFEFVLPPDDASIELRLQVQDTTGAAVVQQRLWRFASTVPFEESLGLLPGTYRLDARTDSGSQVTRELKIEATMAGQPLRFELR